MMRKIAAASLLAVGVVSASSLGILSARSNPEPRGTLVMVDQGRDISYGDVIRFYATGLSDINPIRVHLTTSCEQGTQLVFLSTGPVYQALVLRDQGNGQWDGGPATCEAWLHYGTDFVVLDSLSFDVQGAS